MIRSSCCSSRPAQRALSAAVNNATSTRNFCISKPALSHIGSSPVVCPSTVQLLQSASKTSQRNVALEETSTATTLRVVGPKGEIPITLQPFVKLSSVTENSSDSTTTWSVAVEDSSIKHQRAIWGLTRSLIANAIEGVSNGFTLSLRLVGVGYRAAVEESSNATTRLNMKLGFAHPVIIELPSDIKASTPSSTTIVLSGIDKQRLGEVAARIRSWRVPEPYNVSNNVFETACMVIPVITDRLIVYPISPAFDFQGKGIFVGDETVRRKEVKKK
jgi:large subunit ribosomal protein L6